MTTFAQKLQQLKSDLITQGNRVVDITLRAVESYFEGDREKASAVIQGDQAIDAVDVELERAATHLLTLGERDEYKVRSVVTISKINNELERIADCAVNIAEVVEAVDLAERIPSTFRVMANSVVGMLRDANNALANNDVQLAERVLRFDDAVDRFKKEIFVAAEQRVASGEFSVQFAFPLRTVTAAMERIADHCTNICEQVIYLETGKIVRHLPEGWTKPEEPTL